MSLQHFCAEFHETGPSRTTGTVEQAAKGYGGNCLAQLRSDPSAILSGTVDMYFICHNQCFSRSKQLEERSWRRGGRLRSIGFAQSRVPLHELQLRIVCDIVPEFEHSR